MKFLPHPWPSARSFVASSARSRILRFGRIAALAAAAGPLLVASAPAQIAAHVVRARIAGIDLIADPTGVKDVVTLRGSLPAGDAFAGDGNAAIPTLVGMMLDQGTTSEDKFAIAQKLESVGATLSFEVGPQLVEISAQCLKKDVPLVVGLIAEQLRSPAFSADEFDKVKQQFVSGMKRQLDRTDFRASDAFSRAIYPAGHPNRPVAPETMIAAAGRAALADARAFHAKYYGPAHLTLVAVGDLDIPQLQAEIGRAFAGWTGGRDVLRPAPAASPDRSRKQTFFMAGKTSVTVILGQASGLRYRDPDYQALRLGTVILGRGFTGRLMANVRDKEGLTYDIYATTDHDTLCDGDWRIQATFAPALLEKGVASLRRQLDRWYENGVTDDELGRRKSDLVGSYKVGLATTEGMAASLLAAINRGYDVSWLDEFPKEVEALTTAEVNAAIKRHLNPANMILIEAGTIPDAGQTGSRKDQQPTR
jgi:zinc protease